jgi:hypothetical protein
MKPRKCSHPKNVLKVCFDNAACPRKDTDGKHVLICSYAGTSIANGEKKS